MFNINIKTLICLFAKLESKEFKKISLSRSRKIQTRFGFPFLTRTYDQAHLDLRLSRPHSRRDDRVHLCWVRFFPSLSKGNARAGTYEHFARIVYRMHVATGCSGVSTCHCIGVKAADADRGNRAFRESFS